MLQRTEWRGRPANEHDLRLVTDYLRAHEGAGASEISRALSTRERPFTRRMVNSRLGQLQRRGVVDRDNVVVQEELWPAYLLLDVDSSDEVAVRSALRTHPDALDVHRAVGIDIGCTLLVRTRTTDLTALESLMLRCRREGARDARAVVLRPAG